MSLTHVPVTGTFSYRDADATPAAGEKIHFIAVSAAVVDGEVVTLPKKLICTLDADGAVPADFTLPTVGDGVYYTVREKFSGGRDDYTIEVLTTDTEIDLATVAPVVPTEEMAAYAELADVEALEVRVDALEGAIASGVTDGDKGDVTVSGGGTTWTVDPTLFASPAQGALADTAVQPDDLAGVATSGSYDDLTNKPTLGTAAAADTTAFATAAQGTKADNAQVGIQFKDETTNVGGLGSVAAVSFAGAGVTASFSAGTLTITIPGGGGGGSSAWGAITGTLADQTDLQSALDAKADTADLGTAATTDATDYATAAQGALADSAIQSADLGSAAYESATAFDVNGAAAAAQSAAIAASAPSTHVGSGGTEHALAVASGAAGFMSGTDKAKVDALGTAATASTGDFATAAQGGKADTALQPAAIGSTVQGYDADLAAIAALTPTNDDIVQRKAGAWTNRTMAQLKTDLALTSSDVGLGSVTNDAQTKAAIVPNTAPSAGQVLVGNAGGTAYAKVSVSGDATLASTGALTIAAGAITLAKQANMATASVVYRKTAGSGAPEVQTLATLKTDLGLTGTNSGDQTTIVGISSTKAQFDTACSDGDFAYQSAAINMADTNLQRPILLDYAVLRQAKGSVSGSQTIDITAGNAVSATATGAIAWTFSNPSPTGNMCAVFLRLTNGGAGAQTWPTGTVWDAGTAPTLSASGVDELLFLTSDAGTSWRGFLCAKGQA